MVMVILILGSGKVKFSMVGAQSYFLTVMEVLSLFLKGTGLMGSDLDKDEDSGTMGICMLVSL